MSESHLRVMTDKWGGVQYREGSGTGAPSLKVHSQSGVSDAEAHPRPTTDAADETTGASPAPPPGPTPDRAKPTVVPDPDSPPIMNAEHLDQIRTEDLRSLDMNRLLGDSGESPPSPPKPPDETDSNRR